MPSLHDMKGSEEQATNQLQAKRLPIAKTRPPKEVWQGEIPEPHQKSRNAKDDHGDQEDTQRTESSKR